MYILLLIHLSYADLPVHCTFSDLLGTWIFTMSQDTFTADLYSKQTTCGHGQPGKVQNFEKDHEFCLSKTKVVEITFDLPNIATSDVFGQGTWTLVYDEGFILYFDDIIFTNYFFYYQSESGHTSVCSKTMLGWFRSNSEDPLLDWGCFYGIRENSGEDGAVITDQTKVVSPTATSFLQVSQYDDEEYVDFINRAQSSWKAKVSTKFKGMSFKEINGLFSKTKQRYNVPATSFIQTTDYWDSEALSKTDRDSLIYYWDASLENIDGSKLPESWDWTNINSKSYVSEMIRDQGGCGSCYAFTTVEMLESRLKLLTDFQFEENLSVEYLISCSFYTEGCDGGYPTLLHKFIQEFGLITESCMPYVKAEQKCSFSCENSPYIGIQEYSIVGGYYGAVTEENIMKEIRARGPVILDLEPGNDFFYYSSGVYSQTSMAETDNDVSTESLRSLYIEWEKVTHSVLAVGWGEENGEKYWKCLNSWGDDWGEAGYFRIKRGNDDSHIESLAETAKPFILNY